MRSNSYPFTAFTASPPFSQSAHPLRVPHSLRPKARTRQGQQESLRAGRTCSGALVAH